MRPAIVRIALVATLGFTATAANADFLSPNLPGVTDFDAWDNLTVTNPQISGTTIPFPFPGFPGAGPWPTPIESALVGASDPTGDAQFNKTSGFGYPASQSIYSSPFGNGTYSISDSTPVPGLETVFLQIEIAQGSSGWLDGEFNAASLTVNGGTPVPLLDGRFVDVSIGNAGFGPTTVATFGFQWDVSGLGPITDFDIAFSTAGTSTAMLALQLDQGSEFVPLSIPEPTSLALVSLGGVALLGRRRRTC